MPIRPLGRGSYSEVYLARREAKEYAIKQLNKNFLAKHKKINSVFRERDISSELSDHDYIIDYFGSCQDEENLYFILEYCPNGSLAELLTSCSKYTLPLSFNLTFIIFRETTD